MAMNLQHQLKLAQKNNWLSKFGSREKKNMKQFG